MNEEKRLLPVVINEVGHNERGHQCQKRVINVLVIVGTLLSVYGFYPSTEAFVNYMEVNHSDSALGFDTDEHVLTWSVLLSFSAIVINLGVTPGLLYESISGISQERRQSSPCVFMFKLAAAILSGLPMGALFLDQSLTPEDGVLYWLDRISAYGGAPVFGFTHFLVFSGLWRDLCYFYRMASDQELSSYAVLRAKKQQLALSLFQGSNCYVNPDSGFLLTMKLLLSTVVGGVFLGLSSILGFVLSTIDYAQDRSHAWAGFCYFGGIMFTLMCTYLTGMCFLTVLDAFTAGNGNRFAWYALKADLPTNLFDCNSYNILVLVGRFVFCVMGVLSFAPALGGCLPHMDEWAKNGEYSMSHLYWPIIVGLLFTTPLFNLGFGVGVLDRLFRAYVLDNCFSDRSSKASVQDSAKRLGVAQDFLAKVDCIDSVSGVETEYDRFVEESRSIVSPTTVSG